MLDFPNFWVINFTDEYTEEILCLYIYVCVCVCVSV